MRLEDEGVTMKLKTWEIIIITVALFYILVTVSPLTFRVASSIWIN